jgi:hypothetical protein
MKPIASQRTASILKLTFLFVLLFFIIDGCKKDDGTTGPFDTPTYMSVAGHWTGGGSYFEAGVAKRLNVAWVLDCVKESESTFIGNFTSTYIDANTAFSGWTLICGMRGTISLSRQIAIVDTSGVSVKGSVRNPVDQKLLPSYSGCMLSANGDTISYSGPSPESEVFVLVRQH